MKCAHCPASGRCVVDWTRHLRYCEWAAEGMPERVATIRRLSGDEPEPTPDPEPTPAGTIPLDRALALLARMKACPHRSEPPGCGCQGAACALGKGRGGRVNHQDCRECLSVEA